MTDGNEFLKAGAGDDPETVAKLNMMAGAIQQAMACGFETDGMVQDFMREIRRAMRRGLLEGGREIIESGDDPFYEEDELGDE